MPTSLLIDVGRVAGVAVLVLVVGGLVAVYSDSLRHRSNGITDPTIDAELRSRIAALRNPKQQRQRP
jgi:hypothetical protein